MQTSKSVVFKVAMVGFLTVQAHVSNAQDTNPESQSVNSFTQADLKTMFELPGQTLQLTALSRQEMKETEGA